MNSADAWKMAEEEVRYVNPLHKEAVSSPAVPLWPGIYREESPGTWTPVSLTEWLALQPRRRVELVMSQMRQLTRALDDSGLVLQSPVIEGEYAAFGADELRQGIHSFICRLYQEIRRSDALTALGALSSSVMVHIFFHNPPLMLSESGPAAVAFVLCYGETFCGELPARGASDNGSEDRVEPTLADTGTAGG